MEKDQWRLLVANAKNGDKAAFESLYRETGRGVYFLCLKLMGNEHDAKDVVQDTYMAAFQNLSALDDGVNFPKWINGIAVNKCKMYFRKAASAAHEEWHEQEEEFTGGSEWIPDEYILDAEKRRIIMDIIDTALSDVQRQTVLLYYYGGLSVSEIAEAMECPAGTVTYRLSTARARIKEKVMNYEKKYDDRLYAVIPVSVLTRILRQEAELTAVPDIRLFTDTSAAASTVNKIGAGGKKAMKGSMKGKIIAGVLAALLILVGGSTAVIYYAVSFISNAPKTEGGADEDGAGNHNGDSGNNFAAKTDEDDYGDDDDPDADDYEEEEVPLEAIWERTEGFFEALKSGDAQSIAAYGIPESKSVEMLEELSGNATAKVILETVFADLAWVYSEDDMSLLEYDITQADGDDTITFYCTYAHPEYLYFHEYFLTNFAQGEVVAQHYRPDSVQEAERLLKSTIEALPYTTGMPISITVPDENGMFFVDLDSFFSDLDIELNYLKAYSGDTGLCDYVGELADVISEYTIRETQTPYEEYDEEFNQITVYLEEKDFAGLEAYLSEITGKDIQAELSGTYGSYDELNANQKAFVDAYIAEDTVFDHIDYSWTQGDGLRVRDGMLLVRYRLLDKYDEELTEWYDQYGVADIYTLYPDSRGMERAYNLLLGYYQAIRYAEKNIE